MAPVHCVPTESEKIRNSVLWKIQRCEPLHLEATNILFTCTKVVLWATVYSVYRMWNIAVACTIHTTCLSTIRSKYVH